MTSFILVAVVLGGINAVAGVQKTSAIARVSAIAVMKGATIRLVPVNVALVDVIVRATAHPHSDLSSILILITTKFCQSNNGQIERISSAERLFGQHLKVRTES